MNIAPMKRMGTMIANEPVCVSEGEGERERESACVFV